MIEKKVFHLKMFIIYDLFPDIPDALGVCFANMAVCVIPQPTRR